MKEAVTFPRVNFVEQVEAVERILQAGVRQTLSIHKLLGHSISVWKDGKIVIVPPEEIFISPEFSDPENGQ